VKILLDTHILIWFAEGIDKLSIKARAEIESLNNEGFVSTVSLWEIAIKSSLNKIELKKSFGEINNFIVNNNIQLITVEVHHLNTLLTLHQHHGDPFDRLLIA